MRWVHLGAALIALAVLRHDYPAWVVALACLCFFVNMIVWVLALDEDLRDV